MRKEEGKRETRTCKACPLSAICYVTPPKEALDKVYRCSRCGDWWSIDDHDGVRGRLLAIPWEPCDLLEKLHCTRGWHLDRCPSCVPPNRPCYAAEVVYEAWRSRGGVRQTLRLRVKNETPMQKL